MIKALQITSVLENQNCANVVVVKIVLEFLLSFLDQTIAFVHPTDFYFFSHWPQTHETRELRNDEFIIPPGADGSGRKPTEAFAKFKLIDPAILQMDYHFWVPTLHNVIEMMNNRLEFQCAQFKKLADIRRYWNTREYNGSCESVKEKPSNTARPKGVFNYSLFWHLWTCKLKLPYHGYRPFYLMSGFNQEFVSRRSNGMVHKAFSSNVMFFVTRVTPKPVDHYYGARSNMKYIDFSGNQEKMREAESGEDSVTFLPIPPEKWARDDAATFLRAKIKDLESMLANAKTTLEQHIETNEELAVRSSFKFPYLSVPCSKHAPLDLWVTGKSSVYKDVPHAHRSLTEDHFNYEKRAIRLKTDKEVLETKKERFQEVVSQSNTVILSHSDISIGQISALSDDEVVQINLHDDDPMSEDEERLDPENDEVDEVDENFVGDGTYYHDW